MDIAPESEKRWLIKIGFDFLQLTKAKRINDKTLIHLSNSKGTAFLV